MSHAVVDLFQIIDIPQNHGDTLHHRIVIGKHIFIFILIIKPCCRIDLLAVGKFRNPISILPHAANGMLDDHHEHQQDQKLRQYPVDYNDHNRHLRKRDLRKSIYQFRQVPCPCMISLQQQVQITDPIIKSHDHADRHQKNFQCIRQP